MSAPVTTPTAPTSATDTEAVIIPERCSAYTDSGAPDAVWVAVSGKSHECVTDLGARKLASRYAVQAFQTDGAYDRQQGPYSDDEKIGPIASTPFDEDRPVTADYYRQHAAMAKIASGGGRGAHFIVFYRFRKQSMM